MQTEVLEVVEVEGEVRERQQCRGHLDQPLNMKRDPFCAAWATLFDLPSSHRWANRDSWPDPCIS